METDQEFTKCNKVEQYREELLYIYTHTHIPVHELQSSEKKQSM